MKSSLCHKVARDWAKFIAESLYTCGRRLVGPRRYPVVRTPFSRSLLLKLSSNILKCKSWSYPFSSAISLDSCIMLKFSFSSLVLDDASSSDLLLPFSSLSFFNLFSSFANALYSCNEVSNDSGNENRSDRCGMLQVMFNLTVARIYPFNDHCHN